MMKRIEGMFEKLFFTEALFGQPQVDGNTLTVPVKGLRPLAGHPLIDYATIDGTMIFEGVSSSQRALTEYLGDPKRPEGFKEEYHVEDMQNTFIADDDCNIFSFEGMMENPTAWVDWDVHAQSFELRISEPTL